ncbi:DNA cytosine methyltransferase [Clostridium magnum]|uniref:DNA (cytosine-5-)-methyltransferase n=1 Tax=Clostridium magnum DSM 2767 TaxID=1121326 RepID=A0A162TMX8_9CLOT|nr:DNA cytosine methyltransferase [Clostridium magnum]KZL92844.1 putative BsuMI modification methylase subunit YdiP [Clostridium magnum DSM 2767]SHI28379.1 DNA (cytosine-5)-methyltransferase 1 [Clostridium magnum DSM 2767]
MIKLTLGSLFDGSGGFPLGGMLCGIEPLWASEIEPFPIRVTTKRIPQMKHYGDISTLNGAKLPPVDIISFGSPCTDMSVAGKRAGLDGEQSVLFYEAIRIIKEMRCKTNGRYPRYAIWENVPGAFSSNKGADFKAVLEAVIGILEPTAEMPVPDNGRWPYADVYMGNGWSVAYRTIDAQYFGVPQRRRRIYLVADFAGGCAGEILFEREGMSRDFTPSGSPWQRTAGNAENSSRKTGSGITCLNDQGGRVMSVSEDVSATLRAEEHGHQPCVMQSSGFCTEHSAKSRSVGYEDERSPTLRAGVVPGAVMSFEPGAVSRIGGHTDENLSGSLRANMGDNQIAVAIENHPTDSRVKLAEDNKVQTLTSRMGTGGGNVPLVMNERQYALTIGKDVANTLTGTDYKGTQCVFEPTPKTLKIRSGCDGGGKGALIQDDKSATLGCNNDQTVFVPTAYGICSDKSNSMQSSNPHSGIYEADTSRTIDANGGNPGCNQGGIAVVALQGSMIGRDDKNGPQGSGIDEEVSFTLNTIDRHAVAYAMTTGGYAQVEKDKSPTLLSRDYKDAPIVSHPSYGIDRAAFNQGQNALYKPSIEEEQQPTLTAKGPGVVAQPASFYPQMKAESQCFRQDGTSNTLVNGTNPGFQNGLVEPDYIVRRLTPTECARLQGFPDWWCAELGTENLTEDEIAFWTEVWETHRKIMGVSKKPKSQKQIIKWLQNPHSDAAEYKMWGNGVALPCVCFVLTGINLSTQNTAD